MNTEQKTVEVKNETKSFFKNKYVIITGAVLATAAAVAGVYYLYTKDSDVVSNVSELIE